jgi:hypothetical protein
VSLFLMSVTNLVEAQTATEPNVERAGNELTGEMLECSAYFLTLSWCVDGQDPENRKRYEERF